MIFKRSKGINISLPSSLMENKLKRLKPHYLKLKLINKNYATIIINRL